MFEGSNKEHGCPFHTKVTDLHLDGTLRQIGCHVCVQSKSVLQCTSNVTLLKQTFSSPGAFLKSQTTTGELSSLDDVTSLVAYLGVRDVPVGRVHNEHNSHCRDAMRHRYHHQWCQSNLPHHTPRQRLLRRSQTMVYPVLLDDARTCWTCRFHGMDMVSSNFDDRAPWE